MTVLGPVSKTKCLDSREGVCPGSFPNVTVAVKAAVKKITFWDRPPKPNFWTPGKRSVEDLDKT